MRGVVVQRVEVVEDRLDLWALHDPEPQPGEDVLDLAARLGQQVVAADGPDRRAGQRDVDALSGEGAIEVGALEDGLTLADGELGQGVFLGGADGGGWTITLTASDAAAAVASAGADFEAAGFEIVSETPGTDFRALYSSTDYMVTVSQSGDDITYVVVGAGSSAEPAE